MCARRATDPRLLLQLLSLQGPKKATHESHTPDLLKRGSFHYVKEGFRNTSGSVRQVGEPEIYFAFFFFSDFLLDRLETLGLNPSIEIKNK